MIVQNVSEMNYKGHDGGVTDMTFSCPVKEVPRAEKALADAQQAGVLKYDRLETEENVAKVSVVGIGMRSAAGVAAKIQFVTYLKQSPSRRLR